MKRNKPAFIAVCALSILNAALRILQLLSVTEQGVVSPSYLSVILYILTGVQILCVMLFVRKDHFAETATGCEKLTSYVDIAVIACCVSAAAEGVAGLVFEPAVNPAGNAFALCGGLIAAAFMILRRIGKKIPALMLCGSLLLITSGVLCVVNIFINDQTSLSTTVNIFSIGVICAALFFIKAFAKVFLSCFDRPAVKAALLRPALALILLLPAEIAGRIAYRMNMLANLPITPARSGYVCILANAVLLICVVLTSLTLLSGARDEQDETAEAASHDE